MVIFTTSVTTLGRDQHCAALCGYDKTTIVGMYVAMKVKNPLLLWYKQGYSYEIFHGKYMVFNH